MTFISENSNMDKEKSSDPLKSEDKELGLISFIESYDSTKICPKCGRQTMMLIDGEWRCFMAD